MFFVSVAGAYNYCLWHNCHYLPKLFGLLLLLLLLLPLLLPGHSTKSQWSSGIHLTAVTSRKPYSQQQQH
jgi:hypothetical protein